MTRTQSVAAAVALTSALLTGSAWANDPGSKPVNDSSITKQVRSEVTRETAASPQGIQVKTRNGMVYLTGTVATEQQRRKAEEVARGIEGVTGVQNNLTVAAR